MIISEKLRYRFYLCRALWVNETLCRLTGEWDNALNFSKRGLALAPAEPRLMASRALLEYEIGNWLEGNQWIDLLLEAMYLSTPAPQEESAAYVAGVIPVITWMGGKITLPFLPMQSTQNTMSRQADSLDIAQEAAEFVLSSASATPHTKNLARVGQALISVQRKDVEMAKGLYNALEPYRRTMVFPGTLCYDRLLGLLGVTIGEGEQWIAHFDDALDFCGTSGYDPEVAWTHYNYSEALLQFKGAGSREKAMAHQDEALAIARKLKMRSLIERILSGRSILRA